MKTITHNQYLQLVGLVTLARKHNEMLQDIEKAANEITGPDDSGHWSDIIWGDRELEKALVLMKVNIEPEATV